MSEETDVQKWQIELAWRAAGRRKQFRFLLIYFGSLGIVWWYFGVMGSVVLLSVILIGLRLRYGKSC